MAISANLSKYKPVNVSLSKLNLTDYQVPVTKVTMCYKAWSNEFLLLTMRKNYKSARDGNALNVEAKISEQIALEIILPLSRDLG